MRHLADLPKGYPTSTRGQSCTSYRHVCVEGCPRAAARSGDARSTRMPHEPQRGDQRAVSVPVSFAPVRRSPSARTSGAEAHVRTSPTAAGRAQGDLESVLGSRPRGFESPILRR